MTIIDYQLSIINYQFNKTMEEIFELIKAFNRLKEKIVELIAKVDLLAKSRLEEQKYLDEDEACKFLKISSRTLARLRADGSIPFIKSHRKILYLISDLQQYLNCRIHYSNR